MRALLLVLVACGSEAPAVASAPEPAPAPAPAPAPVPAPAPAPPLDLTGLDAAAQKAALMTLGEHVFKTGGNGGLACITCHGEDGKGMPGAFPPLAGQKDHMGDCAKHAGLVLNGLSGEIVVDGVKYNGVMVPQADKLSDSEIAAVLTYERHSFGNDLGVCLPSDVAAVRAKPAQ